MEVLKTILLLTICGLAKSQVTVQTRVAPILTECYEDTLLKNRDNLPPMTMQTLIEIIRKIEDHRGTNANLREISAAITQLYRQDGIEYHPTSQGVTNVLPYAPTYFTFYRHRLLLSKLIPTNAFTLDNDTITPYEKCALHHMLSTTAWLESRGDESTSCQLSQYRVGRVQRDLRTRSNDVELLDSNVASKNNLKLKMLMNTPDSEVEGEGNLDAVFLQRQISSISLCPLLDGVVNTDWGAVSAGPLIAGIATGAEPQIVRLSDLVKGTDAQLSATLSQLTVDSRFPATLSGDLAEAALRQGSSSSSVSIGASGGWNATQARRFYFLQESVNLEMTEPEIRGGIDGLNLGMYLNQFQTSYTNLKLSQLLDMYYSPLNGVTSSSYRACNRREILNAATTQDNLLQESYSFALALDATMPLLGTITGGIDTLVTNTVNSAINYINNNLNDVQCTASEATVIDYRAKTNLYIVVDRSWTYAAVYPAISYLVQNIEVSKYGSSITILNAADGEIMINKTFSSVDFHVGFTISNYQALPTGVNLPTVIDVLSNLTAADLNHNRNEHYVGGNGTAILFLLNYLNLGLTEQEYVEREAQKMREDSPDFRIIFATSLSNTGTLQNIVANMSDIVQISLTTSQTGVAATMSPVLNRILLVSRQIVNPSCSYEWTDVNSGTQRFEDNVEPRMINFYRLHPNYFYVSNSNRRVRVESTTASHLRICYSRTNLQPRYDNITNVEADNPVTCHDLTSSGNVEINLENACDGYSYIGACPPLHLSVQSVITNENALTRTCTDNTCRFPYNIKYSVVVQDLGCYSSASKLISSFIVLFLTIFIII